MKQLERYRQDPVAFLTECLGMKVDRWQAELIRSRMAKKRPAPKKKVAVRQKPRHPIDSVIRDRIIEERASSWNEQTAGYKSLGFIAGLEWVLLQLEAMRS